MSLKTALFRRNDGGVTFKIRKILNIKCSKDASRIARRFFVFRPRRRERRQDLMSPEDRLAFAFLQGTRALKLRTISKRTRSSRNGKSAVLRSRRGAQCPLSRQDGTDDKSEVIRSTLKYYLY